jgi:transposase
MTRKKTSPVPVEERVRVVLSVLGRQVTMAEAARRHGVADATVAKWRDRFVEAGRASLADGIPGPGTAQAIAERRLRAENEQLKLALAEQMVQLRIWQKGAEHVGEVPSSTSKP